MKKHTYRATNVKSVNGEKIATQVAGQRMVLGIDEGGPESVMETIKWVPSGADESTGRAFAP